MMVLTNAGAFLSETARLQIPLVLHGHGHKHHQHFSRATIRAAEANSYEVAVLATGTPSAGRKPERYDYNFNLLILDRLHNVNIIPYHSQGGGPFEPGQPIPAHTVTEASEHLFEDARRALALSVDARVIIAEISQDGDVHRIQDFQGLHVHDANKIQRISDGETERFLLPYEARVESGPGHLSSSV
jgi:hypothetical protein